MSIVRLGLSERGNAGEGYEAIFGKKKPAKKDDESKPAKAKADEGKKKKKGKKK